jgi:hypothetical protein
MKITLTETITRTYEMEVNESWPTEARASKIAAIDHIADACKSIGFERLKMKTIDTYCERTIDGLVHHDI